MAVLNPFDFFLEPSRRELSRSSTTPELARELAPYLLQGRRRRRASPSYLAEHRRAASSRRPTSWSTLNQRLQKDIALPDPHGAGRADAGGDAASTRSGSCRDTRLAAGAAAAPPRPGGALRLGLPDPAEERRQVARRPERHRGRLHRPARLVRGLPARRRLDRPRPDLGPARRRRPHPARLLARARLGGAGQRRDRRVRDRVRAPR